MMFSKNVEDGLNMWDGSSAGYFHSVDTNISFSPRYNPIINNLGSITQEETTLTF